MVCWLGVLWEGGYTRVQEGYTGSAVRWLTSAHAEAIPQAPQAPPVYACCQCQLATPQGAQATPQAPHRAPRHSPNKQARMLLFLCLTYCMTMCSVASSTKCEMYCTMCWCLRSVCSSTSRDACVFSWSDMWAVSIFFTTSILPDSFALTRYAAP